MVLRPMDLSTVSHSLARRKYTWAGPYLVDVSLVFANCLLYNAEDSDIWRTCIAVRDRVFEALWYV